MELVKHFELGGYTQEIRVDIDVIKDVSCSCRWGTIHREAWKKGEKICKHAKEALKANGM